MPQPRFAGIVGLAVLSGVFCAAGAARTAAAAAPKTWDYVGGGQWQQLPDAAATRPAPEPELDAIEETLTRGSGKAAFKRAAGWLKANRNSPARDRGLYLAAIGLYEYGDRVKAFYYLDELLDEYPDSRLFPAALQKQYDIADAYMNGYKRRFLRLPLLNAAPEGVEMLFRLQGRSPGSPLSEKALLRTADYYYADSQFDFAADAYARYASNYPRSPMVPRVKLRQAYATLAQFRGTRFDATPAIDAREQLVQLTAAYPDLARDEHLDTVLERIDATFARKLYATADFYRRTHAPKGAAYVYRYLLAAYPQAPEAARAKQQLDRLPQWALDVPEPAVAAGYAPGSAAATQPAQ